MEYETFKVPRLFPGSAIANALRENPDALNGFMAKFYDYSGIRMTRFNDEIMGMIHFTAYLNYEDLEDGIVINKTIKSGISAGGYIQAAKYDVFGYCNLGKDHLINHISSMFYEIEKLVPGTTRMTAICLIKGRFDRLHPTRRNS